VDQEHCIDFVAHMMTKPAVTLGIAGGTGAGKVRFWLRKESNKSSRSFIPYYRISPLTLPSCSFFHWQSTLAKSLFETLGGEENVTYLVHDSYYKGKQASDEGRSGAFSSRTVFSPRLGCFDFIVQTKLTEQWKNALRRISIIQTVLTRRCLYNT
jgi:hypothetical protein